MVVVTHLFFVCFSGYSPKVVLEKVKHVPPTSSVARVAEVEQVRVGQVEETDLCDSDGRFDLFDRDEQTDTKQADEDEESIECDPDFEMTEDATAETDTGSADENIHDTIVIQAKSTEPKPKRSKNWKTVGPQELLYRDKFTVYLKDDGFICALCSVKTKTKDNMRGHVNVVHLKHPSM